MTYFSIAIKDAVYAMVRSRFQGTDEEFWTWVERVMPVIWTRIRADERIALPMEALTLVTESQYA